MKKYYFLIAFLLLSVGLFAQVSNTPNETVTGSNTSSALKKDYSSSKVKQQEPSNQDISIYPNPTTTNSISLNTSKDLEVKIYNVLGQKVLSTKVTPQKNKINIGVLKSGVYIMKLKANSGTITKKLIKQ